MALTKVNAALIGGGSSQTFAPNTPIYENTQTISSDTTVTAGSSAQSTGPITIASGVTVTVPDGSKWVVL